MSRPGLVMLAVLAACGGEVAPMPMPMPMPMARAFSEDAVPDAAALFARAELQGDELAVRVMGQKLGPVLGYAFRLDAEGAAVPDPVVEEALADAVIFKRAGRVGVARRGPAAGDQSLDAPTVLARWSLKVGAAPVRLRLIDASVRRANGEQVVVFLAGGELGGAP